MIGLFGGFETIHSWADVRGPAGFPRPHARSSVSPVRASRIFLLSPIISPPPPLHIVGPREKRARLRFSRCEGGGGEGGVGRGASCMQVRRRLGQRRNGGGGGRQQMQNKRRWVQDPEAESDWLSE
jgi:hypothetical protein